MAKVIIMLKSEYIVWKVETIEQIKRDHPEWNNKQVQLFFSAVKAEFKKRGYFK